MQPPYQITKWYFSFRFLLKDLERVDKWLLAIGRKDFTATKFTKICSDHFVYEDFKLNVGGSYRLDLRENVVIMGYPMVSIISIVSILSIISIQ